MDEAGRPDAWNLDEVQPARVVGLDVGERRIGVAVTDGLGFTAQPLFTVVRKNLRADLKAISRVLRRYKVSEIVIGNPLYMSGDQSPQAAKTQAFAEKMQTEFGIPVHLWDERLTTTEAHRYLDEAGRAPGRERRDVIDQVAAVLILGGWLSARAQQRERASE